MLFTKLLKRNSLWFWKQKEHKDIFTHEKNLKIEFMTKTLSSGFFLESPKLMTGLVVKDIQTQFL